MDVRGPWGKRVPQKEVARDDDAHVDRVAEACDGGDLEPRGDSPDLVVKLQSARSDGWASFVFWVSAFVQVRRRAVACLCEPRGSRTWKTF